jgi:hypothetical protein
LEKQRNEEIQRQKKLLNDEKFSAWLEGVRHKEKQERLALEQREEELRHLLEKELKDKEERDELARIKFLEWRKKKDEQRRQSTASLIDPNASRISKKRPQSAAKLQASKIKQAYGLDTPLKSQIFVSSDQKPTQASSTVALSHHFPEAKKLLNMSNSAAKRPEDPLTPPQDGNRRAALASVKRRI